MQNSKIQTYLGFCVKSGKITLGLDRIELLKRAPNLILADKTLSDGSMKKAVRLSEKFACPFVICEGVSLGELIHRPACKLLAVQEKHLSDAILSEIQTDVNFKLLKQFGIGGNI